MPPPCPPRVLPFDPILDRLAERLRAPFHPPGGDPRAELGSDGAIADALGHSRRQVQRWKREGLTVIKADEIAVAIDAHPIELWGAALWDAACDLHDEELARQEGRSPSAQREHRRRRQACAW